MWHKDFESRLASWAELRSTVKNQPLEECLANINLWWQRSPWQPFYLHWDDVSKWPDPWQLLADNVFCDVAKSLGMCYTISMLNRNDHGPFELIQTEDNYNLVHFIGEKYVLNMDSRSIVNTVPTNITRRLAQEQISKRCN
jgi:hypothetical protein